MAVVYEDDDVVVVDKPVGVAAHASVGWTGPTVLGSLIDRECTSRHMARQAVKASCHDSTWAHRD